MQLRTTGWSVVCLRRLGVSQGPSGNSIIRGSASVVCVRVCMHVCTRVRACVCVCVCVYVCGIFNSIGGTKQKKATTVIGLAARNHRLCHKHFNHYRSYISRRPGCGCWGQLGVAGEQDKGQITHNSCLWFALAGSPFCGPLHHSGLSSIFSYPSFLRLHPLAPPLTFQY